MYIVNSGNVLNFCILEVVCLLGDHKTDRFVYYIQMYHDTKNLQTIRLLIIIKITYYQQIFRQFLRMQLVSAILIKIASKNKIYSKHVH